MNQFAASTAAMAAALYVLASTVMWYMVLNKSKLHNRSVVTDRAVAWTSLVLMFSIHVGLEMDWYAFEAVPKLLWVGIYASIGIAGLFSVREMTRVKFGRKILLLFIVVMLSAAIVPWVLK